MKLKKKQGKSAASYSLSFNLVVCMSNLRYNLDWGCRYNKLILASWTTFLSLQIWAIWANMYNCNIISLQLLKIGICLCSHFQTIKATLLKFQIQKIWPTKNSYDATNLGCHDFRSKYSLSCYLNCGTQNLSRQRSRTYLTFY